MTSHRLLGVLAAAALVAGLCAGCGREKTPPNAYGEWLYGAGSPDLGGPSRAGTGGSATEPVAAAPATPTAPAAAPAATRPSTSVARAPSPAPSTPRPRAGTYRAVAVEPGRTGSIRGICRAASIPSLPLVQVAKDNDRGCGGKERPTERFIADPATRGVGNVLVTIPGISEGKDWPEDRRAEERAVTVDQKACRYVPHVEWARPGTQIVVLNSDRADHNIHGYRGSMTDTAFNFSSEPGTKKDDVAQAFLEAPAAYILKCDIHPWMSGYVHVVGNPYADVTSAEAKPGRAAGEFVLEDVPAGEHVLVWWKEGAIETPSVADGKISSYSYSPDHGGSVKVVVKAGEKTVQDLEIPVR